MNLIRPLNVNVVNQISASKSLSSIPQIVIELIQNSLDANATQIRVAISASKLSIEVADNGSGISPDDMKVLGMRNGTSKCSSMAELDYVSTFGYRGEALASISQVSMLEITSRQAGKDDDFSITLRGSERISAGIAHSHRNHHGTTVKVRDCFFNMPVRRKVSMSQNCDAVLEQCKRAIFALAVIAPSVSFVLIASDHNTRILQTKKPSNLRDMFRRTFSEDIFFKTKELHGQGYGQTSGIQIDAVIATNGHHTKKHQYVFVNGRHLQRCELHRRINDYLDVNLNEDKIDEDPMGHLVSPRRTRSSARKLHRYPAYVVRIQCPTSFCDFGFDSAKSIVAFAEPQLVDQTIDEVFRQHFDIRDVFPGLPKTPNTSDIRVLDSDRDSHAFATNSKRSRGENTVIPQRASKRLQFPHRATNGNGHARRPRSASTGAAMIRECIEKWKNPVFPFADPLLPQVDETDELHSVLSNFEASDLGKAQVLGQVDVKFIACVLDGGTGRQLVLIDQHAADERIRLEVLQKQLLDGATVAVQIPLTFSTLEISFVKRYRHVFKSWSIGMDDATEDKGIVTVTKLPECVGERLSAPDVLKATILRHVYDVQDGRISATNDTQQAGRIRNCPRGIIELLNSKACRYAVMFNEELELDRCQQIVFDLSRCQFPFQCAHGRPSVYPVLQLQERENNSQRSRRAVSTSRWRRFMTKM